MQLKTISYLKYKRWFFSVNDNFLSPTIDADADINYYIQVPENKNNALNEFYTLLINLKRSEESIWDSIYHRTRSEISSFIANQEFEHQLLFDIPDAELNMFMDLFDTFAGIKNIRKAERFRLNAYNKNKLLAISYIKQGGQFICINFYRATSQRATNLSSFHLKHVSNNSKYSASYFGRAHKTLHWLDIKTFKGFGAEHYDLCGWYNGQQDKELLNINKFKEQFTQHKVKEYSGVIYKNNFLGLLKKLRCMTII